MRGLKIILPVSFLIVGIFIGYMMGQLQIFQLRSEIASLQSGYSSLQSTYNSLQSEYNSLQSDYSSLQSNYQALQDAYSHLSDDVSSLNDFLRSLAFIPDAFKRTLNDAAIKETAGAVNSAGVSRTDHWSSYQRIYNWITSNIKYVYDVEMPYLNLHWSAITSAGEHSYITGFDVLMLENYVQTPKLTLEIKQGDCDDQAILAYAMIKYYMKYVSGAEYALYIASITFNSGSAHLAVFLPVQGGQLCIVDPAGNYLTSTWWGSITSNPALSELQSYSNHWSSQGGINNMVLYDVNVVDGSYSVIAEGNISEIASIFT